MLDIINQQGAQVVALTERLTQLEQLLTLAFKDSPGTVTFTKSDLTKAETIDTINWKIARNGIVTVTVKRKKANK